MCWHPETNEMKKVRVNLYILLINFLENNLQYIVALLQQLSLLATSHLGDAPSKREDVNVVISALDIKALRFMIQSDIFNLVKC